MSLLLLRQLIVMVNKVKPFKLNAKVSYLVTVGHAAQDQPGSPRLVVVPDAIGCRTFSHPMGKRSQTLLNRERVAHGRVYIWKSRQVETSTNPSLYEIKTSI